MSSSTPIVVLGGQMQSVGCPNSVIVWDPSTKQWRNGPNLNEKKSHLVAVGCHDKVYAIGGYSSKLYNFGYNGEHPSVFTSVGNGNIHDDKTKQQSMEKTAMSLVVSMNAMWCSCCTQLLCCHFGWSHWYRRLVISKYSGYGNTP